MKRKFSGSRKGFTLIELLVVVAIIALLISILLPSLADAREQAKVAKCLSNNRSVMQSTVMYLLDFNDNFPFVLASQYQGEQIQGVCTWAYGGKTNHPDWEGTPFDIEVQLRPMNRYLLGQEPEPDVMEGNTVISYTDVEVLRCPSDTESHQRLFSGGSDLPQIGISCYNDVGTSYHYNLHALEDIENFNPWDDNGWVKVGRALVNDVLAKYSGSYVMYLTDPMDWAIYSANKMGIVGNHGKYNYHEVGFLDGHAEYLKMDTRGWAGPGWTAINPEWVQSWTYRPFPYRYISLKNMDPPEDE